MVELINACRKKSVLSASRKLSSVGCVGKYCSGVLKRSPSGVNADRIAHRNGKRA